MRLNGVGWCWLTDKTADIPQTTLSKTFSWMKILEFWLNFHWINNIPALVLIIAWRRPGNKLLCEPMVVSLLTHTRPQWVKHRPRNQIQIYHEWATENKEFICWQHMDSFAWTLMPKSPISATEPLVCNLITHSRMNLLCSDDKALKVIHANNDLDGSWPGDI